MSRITQSGFLTSNCFLAIICIATALFFLKAIYVEKKKGKRIDKYYVTAVAGFLAIGIFNSFLYIGHLLNM